MSDRSVTSRPRRGPLRNGLLIATGLAALLAAGVLLDSARYFEQARATLRGQAGPAAMPDDGEVGRATARSMQRFGVSKLFGGDPEALPSTSMMAAEQIRGPFPVLSIAADEDYLADPTTGIMANMMETGPEWERLASVSLWEDRELVTGSRVGLRIHGDSTRYRGDPSFRLHFRPMYGATRENGGRLLGPDAAPASSVVVHVVRWRGFYPNIFVFEMARRLGLPAVTFRPARVFLNGQPRGIYVLTERVMPDGWGRTHFGDNDFFMYVYKGETKRPSRAAHAALEDWVRGDDSITMRTAAERIDVGNLTGHLFAVMFAFTTDWAQGAALRDRDEPDARWFWIHWDMDQSFDLRGSVEVEPWRQPFMELVTLGQSRDELEAWGIVTDDRHDARHRGDVRRLLFLELLNDPVYRDYFARFTTDALNHRLTQRYWNGVLRKYRELESARRGGYTRVDLRAYFLNRPDFARTEVGRHLGLGEPLTVRVDADDDANLSIDGYAHRGPYVGRYYRGQTITVEAPGTTTPGGERISHWLVNDRRVDGPRLELAVDRPFTIVPVARR